MSKFADEFVSVPVEVYDDLIRDSNTLYNIKSIIKHELLEGGYSVIGSDASGILMAILGIKEAPDDGSDLD